MHTIRYGTFDIHSDSQPAKQIMAPRIISAKMIADNTVFVLFLLFS